MTQNISHSFKEINIKKAQVKNLSELFILYGKEYICVDKLDIATKTEPMGGFVVVEESRDIKSVADLKQNMGKLCLRDDSGFYVEKFSNPTIYHKGFIVPSTYETISLDKSDATESEKIPYGLKRTLKTEAQRPTKDENAYLYVQIGDKWTFVRQADIYFYDGAEKKTYLEALEEGKDVSALQFFNANNKEISAMYTEYEYKFTRIIKREVLDLKDATKSVVSIDEDGKEIIEKIERINPIYSEQSYEELEVDDETRPGKKKTVGKIKSKNYATVKVDETNINDPNLYIAVTVKDSFNSHTMMAKISDVVAEDGSPIPDLTKMFGKKVKIKTGELVIATTEPLTFEQANLRYDTVKTYQEVESKPTENTCLRLANGSYVKELDSVQPKSFKVAASTEMNFDKYLVQQTKVDGSKVYVVVDKEYFEKHSSANGLDPATSKKLVACAYTDAYCDIVQTTSKDNEIEQCSIVRKIPGIEVEPQEKDDSYKAFKTAYGEGNYFVDTVYVDGVAVPVEKGRRKYEYTDVAYTDDYAYGLHQYRSMTTQNTKLENGKIKGGAKYDVGEANIKAYGVWWKSLVAGIAVVPLAGIFVPVLAPVVAAYGVGVLAAAPLIPIVNAGIALVKNGHIGRALDKVKKFKDKTEYNRKQHIKDIRKEISVLFEIQDGLNSTQFEDAYSKIVNKILMLSATTNNKGFVVENGVGEVNKNNANVANKYIAKYNRTKKKLDKCSKKLDKLKAKGKEIPEKLQSKYDKLLSKEQELITTTVGNSYGPNSNFGQLKSSAAALKFYYYVSHLKGEELDKFLNEVGLTESFKETRISYDIKQGLKLDNVSIYASEKQIKKAFDNDGATIEAWKNVKEMIISAFDKVADIKVNQPINVGVEDIISASNQLDSVYKELCDEINFSIEIEDEYAIKEYYENNQQNLKTKIDDLYLTAKSLYSGEAIKEKIDELSSNKNNIVELKNEIEEASQAISTISNSITDCNTLLSKEKAEIEAEYKDLKKDVDKVDNVVRKSKDIEKIKAQIEIVQTSVEKANKIIEIIDNKLAESDKQILLARISEYYKSSDEKLSALNSTKVKTNFSGYMLILKNNKDLIKEIEKQAMLKETTRETTVELRNKALIINYLIEISVDSLLILEEISKQNGTEQDQNHISRVLREMAEITQTDKDMSTEELKVKLAKAKLKYEHELAVYMVKVETTTVKPTRKPRKTEPKMYNTKINSEDRLVVLLNANPDSKDRKKLIEFIQQESGIEITEHDIKSTIELIDARHKKEKDASRVAASQPNSKIEIILKYGQKFLTEHAIEVKEHIVREL